MKLIIRWRYPDEVAEHEHTFYDIDPKTISINSQLLHFGKDPNDDGWIYHLNNVLSMRMEEE